MPFLDLKELENHAPLPGFTVQFVHSEHMTLAYWTILPNSVLPEHAHQHEQVMNVLEGRFELKIAGESRVLGAGAVAIIPPGAPHSGRALTRCRVLDAFYPVRKDYL